jgi:hypothetical protein
VGCEDLVTSNETSLATGQKISLTTSFKTFQTTAALKATISKTTAALEATDSSFFKHVP